MKALFLSLSLVTMTGIAYCQSYTLPSVLFDSMVFEVSKGRSCDSLAAIRATRIKDQGEQLLNQDKALALSQTFGADKEKEVNKLSLLLKNNEAQQKIYLKLARKKSRKVGFIAGIGVLVIVEGIKLFTP